MVHSLRSGLKKIGYILNGCSVALQTFSCLHEFIAEGIKSFVDGWRRKTKGRHTVRYYNRWAQWCAYARDSK